MEQLNFEIDINAPAARVWQSLWNDASYREWTSVFYAGSYMKGELKPGGRIHFLAPSGGGMFSDVDTLTEGKQVTFRHLGMVDNFIEQPSSEETKTWEGAREGYLLTETGSEPHLKVTLEIVPDHADYFREKFPQALSVLKKITEKATSHA